jgi:hypothetical protein
LASEARNPATVAPPGVDLVTDTAAPMPWRGVANRAGAPTVAGRIVHLDLREDPLRVGGVALAAEGEEAPPQRGGGEAAACRRHRRQGRPFTGRRVVDFEDVEQLPGATAHGVEAAVDRRRGEMVARRRQRRQGRPRVRTRIELGEVGDGCAVAQAAGEIDAAVDHCRGAGAARQRQRRTRIPGVAPGIIHGDDVHGGESRTAEAAQRVQPVGHAATGM